MNVVIIIQCKTINDATQKTNLVNLVCISNERN